MRIVIRSYAGIRYFDLLLFVMCDLSWMLWVMAEQ